MPSYLYQSKCGEVTQMAHSMFEEPKPVCNTCGDTMTRKPQAPKVEFKGEGFYSNDSKRT